MNQNKYYEAKITFSSDYPRSTIKKWLSNRFPLEVIDVELTEIDKPEGYDGL